MSLFLFFIIVVATLVSVSLLLYRISKGKWNRLAKYVPAIVFLVSIVLFFIKMMFISEGYTAITDIIVLICLAFGLGISLLGAIIFDILIRKKRNLLK